MVGNWFDPRSGTFSGRPTFQGLQGEKDCLFRGQPLSFILCLLLLALLLICLLLLPWKSQKKFPSWRADFFVQRLRLNFVFAYVIRSGVKIRALEKTQWGKTQHSRKDSVPQGRNSSFRQFGYKFDFIFKVCFRCFCKCALHSDTKQI